MPTVRHADLTGADLHEPKGADSAVEGSVYVSNGAGSGAWKLLSHAACYYANIGTGVTYTAPTTYTLVNPTTTGDAAPIGFTHNGTGRLTYTGTSTVDVTYMSTITVKHSTGAGADCYFQLHKNGTPVTGAEVVVSADSANYHQISLLAHTSASTNDYFEIYCKVASGNIIVHAMNILMHGHQ